MQARLKYIPIEQLVHYAGKKVSPCISYSIVCHIVASQGRTPSLRRRITEMCCHVRGTNAHIRDVYMQQAAAQAIA